MSGQPTTHGMRHLPEAHKSARGTAGLRETICRLVAVEVQFCALNGTKA
ncbi:MULTISPECIES: hypothetical protein [Mesorhizobium]|uniref:Transposase n=1 Tax=Mesorhizobium japonicum R7A TaxID=935547 RepID=A0ABX6MLC1_9HYPH|nr:MULTISPECIES: hypothetical protein [Mesorhizobium]MBE1710592.1 hypothetical protein [Mesorhizobium japonicum]MBE1712490.1 hypothetical protein [Mesorhizobium japonicum]MUT24697.1 hypothetical protein [Mesorhizobium japonicum]MUT29321.1 hypothetical protein [Mesorhizobium japonicum]QJF00138.1 hypothetical protein R7A2020_03970 [Mesorhizobium japonicum R7A]